MTGESTLAATVTPITTARAPVVGEAPVTLMDRRISKATLERYGVTLGYNGEGDVTDHHYPYMDTSGSHLATKTRRVATKDFYWTGQSNATLMFGTQLVPEGGKYVTITEGEIDAMTVCEAMGYPALSVKSASTAVKDVQSQYRYLQTFDKIVLCFDNDEAGSRAAREVAQRFEPGKVLLVDLGAFKDANEMVKAGEVDKLRKAWYNAKPYTPDNIINSSLLWDLVSSTEMAKSVLYPYDGLNKKTYGIRKSELISVTAGTGIGKSTFCKALAVYLKDSIAPDENIGMLMIEESTRETALTMMGLNAGKPFHLPDSGHTPEQLKKAYEDTLGTGRFYLQQDKMFAYSDIDGIIGTIKYLANGCNCKYIILDHISIITSAQENGDERRALDAIVTRLKSLAMQLDIALIIVCHLKRLSGTPAEEGAQITLNDLRGTHGIGQLSNIILALERNGQAPDPKEANTINVRVLKNRFCGRLGVACTLVFDDHHMKFEEIVPPIQQVDGDTSGLPKIGDG